MRIARRATAIAAVIALGSAALAAPSAVASDQEPDALSAVTVDDLAVAEASGAVVVTAPAGTSVVAPSAVDGASRATIARTQLERTAQSLDLPINTEALRTAPTRGQVAADAPVRFVQWLDGLPVYGSSVAVSLDEDGGLRALVGATAQETELPNATVSAASARQLGKAAVADREDEAPSDFVASAPYAVAYAPELLGDDGVPARAWRTFVKPTQGIGGYEVIVDPATGEILSSVERIQRAQRGICDGANDYTDAAAYGWCGENDDNPSVPYVRSEGEPATGNVEADAAYDALGDTTTFFNETVDVDINGLVAPTDASIYRFPGTNRTLAGVVRYCDPVEAFGGDEELAQLFCPLPNAYWYADESEWNPALEPYPGGQMFIGQGFATSVDVIAHEVSHGVTSATSNLIYQGESGAINESMSDIFGQLVQVYADENTDPAWDLGEDISIPASVLFDAFEGPIRSMASPGDYDQPSTMTDPLWDLDPYEEDQGGVHSNSGVGNYAAYLMAHGGTVNGVSVAPLDGVNGPNSKPAIAKLARLYWATQGLLPSNANYRVLGLTLAAACEGLVGSAGFTAEDCSGSVAKAVAVTGMTKLTPSLSAASSSVAYGKSVTLTGQIKDARGTAVGGASARLDSMPVGSSTWSPVKTMLTSSSGKATATIVPTRTTSYRLVALSGGLSASTGARTVVVTPTVSRAVAYTTVSGKQAIVVTGKVAPTRAGQPIRLERYSSGSWKLVRSGTLYSSGSYRLTYTLPAPGSPRYQYRVVRPAESAYGVGISGTFWASATR